MTRAAAVDLDLDVAELRERLALGQFADDVLEACVRERLSLRATLDRFLAALAPRLGAVGAAVVTRDEELNQAAFRCGDLGGEDPWTLLDGRPAGVHAVGPFSLVSQPLDVAGQVVGQAGFLFEVAELGTPEAMQARVSAVCEQLDAVLAAVHTASEKQSLIERINRALSNRVFERGLDDAVAVLFESVPFKNFVFVWRDAVDAGSLFYRLYRAGRLEFDSERRPHPGLQAAIRSLGPELLSPERRRLRTVLGLEGHIETVIVSGTRNEGWLGKFMVQAGPGGFSTFALDLVRLLAEMARERLVDYNRERRHLAKFFPPRVINALLREPAYVEKYLAPREEKVAILFADLNGFTRICEQVLEKPAAIGQFVDRWSAGAVDLLWKHGGMFDKMVGDCIIGLFGPPFFAERPEERALQALRAASAILEFTIGFGDDPLLAPLRARPDVAPGLGVAVGVNLCPAYVGSFGPNNDLTAFSSGMNATARLQSLAGYREILAMDAVVEAMGALEEGRALRFGPFTETPVKNVLRPLRYARLER